MLAQAMAAQTTTAPMKPRLRLVREWRGKAHVVTVGEDRIIRWNEKEWGSPSEFARAITVTRWSGPAFLWPQVQSRGMKKVRCGIYTRKSSVLQDFNSLDAQHEACAAYILSQASEGWIQVAARYDDGGLSGGTLERPALQRLLVDVAEGRIDIIVVYKVDQLTRSLLAFPSWSEHSTKAATALSPSPSPSTPRPAWGD